MTVLPKRYTRNTIANYVSAFSTLLLALLVTPILVRGLGKEAYGVWALVGAWVVYFNLLQFGTGLATVKFVAQFEGLGDRRQVARVIGTSFFGLAIPASLLLLAAPGLAYLFPAIFEIPPGLTTAAMVVVVLGTIDLAMALPANTFGSAIAGFQRYDLLAVTVTGTAIAQAVSWAIIVTLGGGLVPIGVAAVTFSVTAHAARFLMVWHLVGENPIARRNFDRGFVRPLLAMSGWVAVAEFAGVFIWQIDVLVVGLVTGVPEAGVYAVGQKLSNLPARLTGPLTSTFFPYAAELAASGDREGLRNALLAGTRIAVGVATPLAIAISVLAKPTIDAWVGPGFDDAALVVVFLSSAAVIGAMFKVPAYTLRGLGDVKYPASFAVLEGALNFGLSIPLGIAIGPVGVALATLIASAFTEFLIAIPYACRRTQTSIAGFYWSIGRRILPAAGAALGVGFLLLGHGIDGLAEVMGAGCCIILAYCVVMLFTGVSADERRLIYARVSHRLARSTG